MFQFIKPHLVCQNINSINFAFLKNSLGIKYLIFDKDDTITAHHVEELHKDIDTSRLRELVHLYKNNIFIVSNSRRKWKIDYSNELNDIIEKHEAFRSIVTKYKKPFNFSDVIQEIGKLRNVQDIKGNEICIIGDRILTDMALAHKNGCFGIYVNHFEDSVRSWDIDMLKMIEEAFIFKPRFGRSVVKNSFNGVRFGFEEVFQDIN